MLVVTVARALALEVVTLHATSEALALAHGDDVDLLAGLEDLDRDLLPDDVVADRVEPQLHHLGPRLDACCLEVPCLWTVEPVGLLRPPGDLEGGVAIGLRRLDLDDPQGRDLDGRDRDGPVLLVPDLGHAGLLADDRLRCHDVTFLAGCRRLRRHANAPLGGSRAERSTGVARCPSTWRLPGTSAVGRLHHAGARELTRSEEQGLSP